MTTQKTGKRFKRRWLPLGLFVLMMFNLTLAVEKQDGKIEFKPKTVAVFKNGLGFFIFEGAGKIKEGKLFSEFLPEATLGTFWLASLDPKTEIIQAVAGQKKLLVEKPAMSLLELLKANVGKELVFYKRDGEPIIGKIVYFPEPEKPDLAPFPLDTSKEWRAPAPIPSSQLMIIETESAQIALDPAEIAQVEFAGAPTTNIKLTEEKKILEITLKSEKDEAKLQMSFLQKGIAWFPSYNVDISDEQKARLTLQAILVNDAFDLEDAEAYFIVGYPNIQFAELVSPLALQHSLAQMINLLNLPHKERRYADVLVQKAQFARDIEAGPGIVGYETAGYPEIEGTTEEDLFFYRLPGISLKKFQRGYYNIFSDAVEYKHIYTLDIPITTQEHYYQSQEKPDQSDEVWHCIKLKNTTQHPWTTAPAFVTRSWKPLGQDQLKYTPKGDMINLRITQAVDIKVSRKEAEIERQEGQIKYSRTYDLIKVKGELEIKNFKTKPVEMEIKKKLIGKVLETDPAGEVVELAEGLRAVNQISEIKWTPTLAPGEKKTITYVFQIYIER
ncbi:MAG: DUF4139 domain-containing protein [Candidatus Sumerlaeia bacterium]|nr:DUF4139 domain-containing protein [Candidatus Sumerlaeia bacterium]